MNIITTRDSCRWCWSKKLHKILDLWNMPLAWGFLKSEDIKNEIKIPLDLFYCEECNLVQITSIVNPEILFKNYFYISSVIPKLAKHFYDYSIFLREKYLLWDNPKILEMWCNDGVLLQNFINDTKIFSLWIEPSNNVSKFAIDKWIQVINTFFTESKSQDIVKEYWEFDIITWSNMFAHIDNIIDVIHWVKNIIKKDWVFIFEVHYLLDLMKDFQYDTIYHEHLTYYSIIAIKKIFELQLMKIIDVIHLDMHGGGIRVVTSLNDSRNIINDSVKKFIDNEIKFWLDKLNTYMNFWDKVIEHKRSLIKILTDLKKEWKQIVWYWAPWRWTILLNYCNIDNTILDYIVDLSPLRKWMLMPWVHLEINDPTISRLSPPDFFLVLAWNYIDSILEQEKDLVNKWVKFIVPFPLINII